jgi:molybdenum cofactor synthesis domain-containing protein
MRECHDVSCLFSHQIEGLTAVCTIEKVPKESHSSPFRTAAVITVSDGCARGERQDLSGPALARTLDANGFRTVSHATVPDEREQIEDAIRKAAGMARLVVTTGGTGIGPRDVTPEATRAVCDRLLEGVAELMRAEGRRETAMASLSRAVCGTLGTSLVLNVPGSPAGAAGSLLAALPVLPHALDLLEGKTEHGADSATGDRRAGNASKHGNEGHGMKGHRNKGKG